MHMSANREIREILCSRNMMKFYDVYYMSFVPAKSSRIESFCGVSDRQISANREIREILCSRNMTKIENSRNSRK